MTPTTTLTYQDHTIRRRGAMLNLTDMWKAAGRPEDRRPSDWLPLEETQRFRAHAGTQLAEAADPVGANADDVGICHLDTDGLVATVRGHQGGTWAHWQLALSYARYLSPPFHLWCNTVVRAAMERLDEGTAAAIDPLAAQLARYFRQLNRRLDALDRHAADLMLLQLSSPDLLLGRRRHFSERSQAILCKAVAALPYEGRCPCCESVPVLTEEGRPVPGAEFDHVFHRGLNRPEHGWLVCEACHAELTCGGYLIRFERMPAFRRFQTAVLAQRRRTTAASPSPWFGTVPPTGPS